MSKVVDITDKISFDENPKIIVKGETLEVNADAETMLKIMGAFQNKGAMEASLEAYGLLFSEKDREKINKMKPQFKDFMKIIEIAMDLAKGEEEPGEQ